MRQICQRRAQGGRRVEALVERERQTRRFRLAQDQSLADRMLGASRQALQCRMVQLLDRLAPERLDDPPLLGLARDPSGDRRHFMQEIHLLIGSESEPLAQQIEFGIENRIGERLKTCHG